MIRQAHSVRRRAVHDGKRRPGRQESTPPTPKNLSRLRKPEELSLEEWQVALRRQYGRQQEFRLRNLGSEPLFSEFEVTNPQSGRTYRVAIRGQALGENYCSCPDFAVNTLGTCKHIEFTLARLGRRRGAKAALALGHRPMYSEVYLQYGARREVVFCPGARCPAALKAYAGRYFDSQNRLKEEACTQFHNFLSKAASGKHEVRCYDDALAFIAQLRDRAELARRVAEAFPKGIHSAAFRKLISTDLYPYQREGALFAAKSGRCLIADDMGLGKTIQAIAAAEILARTVGIERILIISPTSLKHQWKHEIERFTDRTALVVEGLLHHRRELYAAESFYKLTNYDVIHRDLEAIRQWQPDLIVLDEAQRIKNWKTRAAQTVKQLHSPYAIVLTGTPLENRLEELHSIVEFVDRFRLGPLFRFLAEHQHVDQGGRVVGYRNLSKISQTLSPILIRRTKEKVLKELPQRMEKRFFVPMTPQQMEYHEENREIVARLVQKWRRHHYLSEGDQLRMRIALQNMRMACNSTYLLDQKTDHGGKTDELVTLLSEMFEEPETKVVIFSQWLRTHELVVARLEKSGWGHVLFHGGVPGPKRKDLVTRFREDPGCRLFLSTDAGGVGLNLQNASVVVNMDQPWNPAVLEQRIGRVHRLGQRCPVRVVHFIAQGTIEEGMLNLLAFKRSLFSGVLDDGKDEVFLGGTRLKRFMESVQQATESIPAAMPQTSAAEEKAEPPSPRKRPVGPAETAPQDRLWQDVVATGASLLDKFMRAVSGQTQQSSDSSAGLSIPVLTRDEATGQAYLKLPLPEPDTLRQITQLLTALTQNLKG